MSLQKTRLDGFQRKLSVSLSESWIGPWKKVSFSLISLLSGFYLANNLTIYYLQKLEPRPLIVLGIVLIVECMVRLRSIVKIKTWSTFWIAFDNFRLGVVYAFALEAFKLGS